MNHMTTACLLLVFSLLTIQPAVGFIRHSKACSSGFNTECSKAINAQYNDGCNNAKTPTKIRSRSLFRTRASWLDEIGKSSTSTALSPLEKVQQGFLALTENIPKPILMTLIAVASGLFFFELSKAILLLSLPIILILGGAQSIKESIEESVKGPRVFDTEILELEAHLASETTAKGVDADKEGIVIMTMIAEDLEIQSLERVGRLAAIQRRISEASGDLRNAIDSASSLRVNGQTIVISDRKRKGFGKKTEEVREIHKYALEELDSNASKGEVKTNGARMIKAVKDATVSKANNQDNLIDESDKWDEIANTYPVGPLRDLLLIQYEGDVSMCNKIKGTSKGTIDELDSLVTMVASGWRTGIIEYIPIVVQPKTKKSNLEKEAFGMSVPMLKKTLKGLGININGEKKMLKADLMTLLIEYWRENNIDPTS
jgi:hypothetical protein